MKFTIKIVTDREGSELLTTEGGIIILTRNDEGFLEMVLDNGNGTPRAILKFTTIDRGNRVDRTCFIYDDSKAYVMNDSGKTVACI